MFGIIVQVTLLVSGKKAMVNMAHVIRMQEQDEGKGCVLYFTDGQKLQVRESMEKIAQKSVETAIQIQMDIVERSVALAE